MLKFIDRVTSLGLMSPSLEPMPEMVVVAAAQRQGEQHLAPCTVPPAEVADLMGRFEGTETVSGHRVAGQVQLEQVEVAREVAGQM